MISRWRAVKLFLICTIISTIANFPTAVPSSSLNTAVHTLRLYIHESYAVRGYVLSSEAELVIRMIILNCWFLAQFVGSVTLFPLPEKYGRLGAFKLSVAAMGFGNLLQFIASFTHLPELFFTGRFIAGVMSPLCATCMVMYLQECTPIHLRGTYSFLVEVVYGFCTTIGMLFGQRSVFGHSIVLLTGIQLVPAVASLIFLFVCLPDTPKFLIITKKDQKRAMKSLVFFQGEQKENVELLEKYVEMEAEQENEAPASLKEIIKLPHIRVTIFIIVLIFVIIVPFYMIFQNSTLMFEYIGIEAKFADTCSTTLFFIYSAASAAGMFIIERYPRRTLILLSGWCSLIFLALFVLFSTLVKYYYWMKFLSVGSIFLYITAFGMILSPICMFISSELCTQRYRTLVFSVGFGFLNVFVIGANSICLFLFNKVGALSFIPLYIIPYVISLLFLWRYLPESKGRESYHVAEVIKLMSEHGVSATKAEKMYAASQTHEQAVELENI